MVFFLFVFRGFCRFICIDVNCFNGFLLNIDEFFIKFEVNMFVVGGFGELCRVWRK